MAANLRHRLQADTTALREYAPNIRERELLEWKSACNQLNRILLQMERELQDRDIRQELERLVGTRERRKLIFKIRTATDKVQLLANLAEFIEEFQGSNKTQSVREWHATQEYLRDSKEEVFDALTALLSALTSMLGNQTSDPQE